MFRDVGVTAQIHYLDDFLFFGRPGSSEAIVVHERIHQTCYRLGVPIAEHKTEGPATTITFLWILIDTVAMQLRLPQDKLTRLRELLHGWINTRNPSRRQLESFVGHLSHASLVISQGRAFLHRLFSCLKLVHSPHHHVRITSEARADILWWDCFVQGWNGLSFMAPSSPSIHVYSDAAWYMGAERSSLLAIGFRYSGQQIGTLPALPCWSLSLLFLLQECGARHGRVSEFTSTAIMHLLYPY